MQYELTLGKCAGLFLVVCITHALFAVTAERTLTVRDLVQLTVLSRRTLAIAPRGNEVAYVAVTPEIASDSYLAQLRVAKVDGNAHVYDIAAIKRRAVRSPETDGDELPGSLFDTGIHLAWSDDGTTLFYSIEVNGRWEVHEWDSETKRETTLLVADDSIESLAFHASPAQIEYCVTEVPLLTHGMSDPAFHYDPKTFDPTRADLWAKVNSGTHRIACRSYSLATAEQTVIAAPASRRVDPITMEFTGGKPKTYLGWPVVGCFPAPSRNVLLCGAEKPRSEMVGVPGEDVWFATQGGDFRKTQEVLQLHGREWESTNLIWTDEGNILEIRRGPNSSQIKVHDLRDNSVKLITKSAWGIYNAHVSENGHYLFATREKPNIPAEFVRIDLLTGKMILLDRLNPQFAAIRMPLYKSVSIPNKHGDVVNGYLFLPLTQNNKPHPFVAIRGEEENGFALGTGEECPGLVLASRGYYVFFFEMSSLPYHPSGKGNTAYTLLRWKSPLASIQILIDQLAKEGLVDKSKTGIAGLSAGADLVDYASVFSDIFHAGEATTGEVPAPPNYLLFDNARVRMFFHNSMSLPFPDASGIGEWSHVSATLNASRTTMPVLFQPPDSEALAGFWQPAAMIRLGMPADLYVYPDEGHIKVHPLNRYYVMLRNLQWFDFWLRRQEDLRRQFAVQFERWECMLTRWKTKTAR